MQVPERFLRPSNTLLFTESLRRLESAKLLTDAQRYLANLILVEGRIYLHQFPDKPEPVPIVDVTRFLNHRLDPELISRIGKELGQAVLPWCPNVVLTAAASGIAPASSLAINNGGRLITSVYAVKSEPPLTMYAAGVYHVTSRSYTGGGKIIDLSVARDCLLPNEQVLIVDEFLDEAVTSSGLVALTEKARAITVGAAFVIEKVPAGGRQRLIEEAGLPNERIVSLLVMEDLGPGWMKVRGIMEPLSLRRNGPYS